MAPLHQDLAAVEARRARRGARRSRLPAGTPATSWQRIFRPPLHAAEVLNPSPPSNGWASDASPGDVVGMAATRVVEGGTLTELPRPHAMAAGPALVAAGPGVGVDAVEARVLEGPP